ncbi:MAG: DNA polymerase III subunit alpha, partial [Synergistaceae bacterium]|nr:DNA polymerase III subunit alpha [Synergistaceae bacterium]
LDYEKQVTGMYISGHPYETHQEELSPYTNCKIMDLNGWKSENIKPCVGGIIASIKEKTTKKGSNMCNLQLEDTEGSIDVVIFPKMWEELKGTLTVGDACVIEGKFDDRGQLLPDKIMMADDLNGKAKRYITLSVDAEECRNMNLKRFVAALNGSKGNSRVILELKGEGETFCVYLGGCNIDAERLNDSLLKVMPSGSFSVHCGAA